MMTEAILFQMKVRVTIHFYYKIHLISYIKKIKSK